MDPENDESEVIGEIKKLVAIKANENAEKKAKISPTWKQAFVTVASLFGALAAGSTSGYSAILIPQLNETSNNTINLTEEVVSWIAAMPTLPLGFANILSGVIMDYCGRRNSHFFLCVPFVAGWIIIALSNNLTILLIGRFITGFCQGLHGPLAPVYIGETSSPKKRGIFLASISVAVALGILFSHLIGTILSWRQTALICSLLPVLCIITMYLSPESPSWLASKNRQIEAIKSFKWLRGHDNKSNKELQNLLETQVLSNKPNNKITSFKVKIDTLWSMFKRPEFYKPLLIMIGFFIMNQFCGVNVISFYTATIMKNVLHTGFNEYHAMIIIDISRLIMSGIGCVLSLHYGRRPLILISGFLTMASLFALSLYLYLHLKGYINTNYSWIPISLVVLYVVFSSIGIIPLPWMMVGEVFPISGRGLGSGISICTTSIAFFSAIKIAPAMFSKLGLHGTFFFYGCVSLFGTCTLYKYLPETKGKTLQEIEERFKST